MSSLGNSKISESAAKSITNCGINGLYKKIQWRVNNGCSTNGILIVYIKIQLQGAARNAQINDEC
jgi:hypothetical protein